MYGILSLILRSGFGPRNTNQMECATMKVPTQLSLNESFKAESPAYLKEQIITYIGNKRSLLGFIENAILEAQRRHPTLNRKFSDVFAGTGIVSRMARQYFKELYINDLEAYSVFTNKAHHTNRSSVDEKEYLAEMEDLNKKIIAGPRDGFITELYAPKDEENIQKDDRVFYTRRNARYIDTARQIIGESNYKYADFFLASLIQKASVHTNTSGVFKGFYKDNRGVGQFGGNSRNALSRIMADINIEPLVFSEFERQVHVSQLEAADFARSCEDIDIAYLDPPYNQHPYGSNYFMLNTILSYERPDEVSRVSGIPKVWNRSSYNKKHLAKDALFETIINCNAKVVLLSYNSEGFIPVEELIEGGVRLGEVTVFDEKYNTFRGCRNLKERAAHVTEHLIMIERI